METLIFIAIAVVITIIQKKLEKAKEQQHRLPPQHHTDESNEPEPQESQEQRAPRSLQDLIRQFEEAQRQATQGNIEPPTPPVQKWDPNKPLTLRDIAEVVIEVDFINLEFLMDEFNVDENTAAEMLMALQDHRIVGHDMGEGDCDVLVHDLEELDNLLSREKRAKQERESATRERHDNDSERERTEARRQELERQRELNALEDRARAARESAAAISSMEAAEASAAGVPMAARKPAVSAKNIADVRKGFIWAKVLDEPRFKKRWSAMYR